MIRQCSLRLLSILATTSSLLAQGTGSYFNVESPQRKPITVVRIQNHDFLAVCNTPDNSVEIYDTRNNEQFVKRIQTGAEPISIVYNRNQRKLFTCNYLGDSITAISLAYNASNGSLNATLDRTVYVGDEPNHISFAPDGVSLFVTLGSQSAVARLSLATLQPHAPGSEKILLLDHAINPTRALKDPCTTLVRNGQLFTLAHRGGKNFTLPPGCTNDDGRCDPSPFGEFDFDVRAINIATGAITEVNNLGTLNFNMTFSDFTGPSDLWVVGTDAKINISREAVLKVEPFGFVSSKLYRVVNAGTATPTVFARDLNMDMDGSQVPSSDALAQPTDIVLYEPDGVLCKAYVAAFNSDRVGVISNLPMAGDLNNDPLDWPISTIAIPKSAGSSNPMAGPRGLAIKHAIASSGELDRLYVLNRIDNSVSVIDPVQDEHVKTFALRRDPTPEYIRSGREFLYGAHHSGSGIVSCASCHVDGRSDFLRWNLSSNILQSFPEGITDGVNNDPQGMQGPPNANGDCPESSSWPILKGTLVTQTLQGMVNFETRSEVQPYFSNQPFHWRGDRASFEDFNAAFVDLLGRSTLLTDEEMNAFRDFAFSIAYPPNPEQLDTRTLSGALGDVSTLTDGTGAARGLKLYAMQRLDPEGPAQSPCSGRSCIQCHWLPEGSNNKITLFDNTATTPGIRHPLETPGIRFLRQKERVVDTGIAGSPLARTALFGLLHDGGQTTIRNFIDNGFGNLLQIGTSNEDEVDSVTQFVHELDTGVGPLVGRSYFIDFNNKSTPATTAIFSLLEGQAALANTGLALEVHTDTPVRGYWFDLTQPIPKYRNDVNGALVSRTGILALLTDPSHRLVLHATALGSERRTAWQGTGSPPLLTGPSPMNVTLEAALPNSLYRGLPDFTLNWEPGVGPGEFDWTGDLDDDSNASCDTATGKMIEDCVPTPPFLRAIRIFQYGLIQDGPGLGLSELRHEFPRRLRVSMDNGRHGAKLHLKMGTDPNNPPPNSTTSVTFELPLHPTGQLATNGRRIWETHVELDALALYTLMLGGPAAPRVMDTLTLNFECEPPPLNTFNPTLWNSFEVQVINTDQSMGPGNNWQPLHL